MREAASLVQSGQSAEMTLPLSFGLTEKSEWMFPIEPLISISGKNVIVKRSVAKPEGRGTIKERWAEDDLRISIQGSFVSPDLSVYPEKDVQQLMYYIRQRQPIYVKNELLAMLNIHRIVIESFSFPFTKGENVQNYTIEAVSDELYNLLIEM